MALFSRITNGGSASSVAPGSPKALQQRFQNCISFLWPTLIPPNVGNRKSTHIDVIDCFTNDLVTRNTKKWEDLRDSLVKTGADGCVTAPANSFNERVGHMTKTLIDGLQQVSATQTPPNLGLDIRSLSVPQLNNLLLSTLEIKNKIDFLYLIKQCIVWQKLPSSEVLTASLKYLSSLGKLQQIDTLNGICESRKHPLSMIYVGFAPFRAMAQWHSGQTDVALKTLSYGYATTADSDEGRRMIRAAFRTVIEETLSQKSEAVLVTLLVIARNIYTKYNDIFVLAYIWKQCFLSEWFCDQKSAALLFDEYKDLQTLVGRRSSSLCNSFLRQSNVDAVHRLIEAFLQNEQRDACANCLAVLFDYQYFRQDLRACAEIIKSCSELKMPLNEAQNEQFLSLFINQAETTPKLTQKSQRTPQQFEYKF